MDTIDDFVEKVVDHPEVFFNPTNELSMAVTKAIKFSFDYAKQNEPSEGLGGPLDELYTEGFDPEQIWEELQLQNKPMLQYLTKKSNDIVSNQHFVSLLPTELESSENEELSDDASQSNRRRRRMGPSSLESSDESSDEESDQDGNTDSSADETRITAEKVGSEFFIDASQNNPTKGKTKVDDDFFSIESMDKFENMMEKEEMDQIFGEQQYKEETESKITNSNGSIVSGGEDELAEMNDNDDSEYQKLSTEVSDADDSEAELERELMAGINSDYNGLNSSQMEARTVTGSDFFGRKHVPKNSSKKDVFHDELDGEFKEQDFENESDIEDQMDILPNEENSDDFKDDNIENNDTPHGPSPAPAVKLSNFDKQQIRMQKKIALLEEEASKSRPWHLQGEAKAKQRPQNSLLETHLEYDRADKIAPVITLATTATLEDMIKQRIKDEAFDDPIRKLAPEAFNPQEEHELSTEKSKEGLGELYARDYLKESLNMDEKNDEKQRHKECKTATLFKKLCIKLDALSNFHFAPKPVIPELEISSKTPAISMEEIIPIGVSTSTQCAPEEVFDKKKGREGLVRGKTELSREDKKRARQSKKTARRKKRRRAEADARTVSRINPGLGNKYAQRRMREDLMADKNVHVGKKAGDKMKLTKSSQFFRQMQTTVRNDKLNKDGKDSRGSVYGRAAVPVSSSKKLKL